VLWCMGVISLHKLKCIIIISIYSFIDTLHCLMDTATAFTDFCIRISQSFMLVASAQGGSTQTAYLDNTYLVFHFLPASNIL